MQPDPLDPAPDAGTVGPALPDAGHGPGVLVLAAGPGAGALAREACARLARHGYVALGVALPAACGGAPRDVERAQVDAALERLFREPACDGARLGLVGLGPGAALALDAAARGARAALLACLDPALDTEAFEALALPALEVPLEAWLAEKPGAEDGEEEPAQKLAALPDARLRVLPGVRPGFLDPARADRYDAAAARAAWDALLARLRAEL